MSGGVEPADILSVLSLVKERWKVVSGAALGLQWLACLSSPVAAGSRVIPQQTGLCSAASALSPLCPLLSVYLVSPRFRVT